VPVHVGFDVCVVDHATVSAFSCACTGAALGGALAKFVEEAALAAGNAETEEVMYLLAERDLKARVVGKLMVPSVGRLST
jgi:hypothetical protein